MVDQICIRFIHWILPQWVWIKRKEKWYGRKWLFQGFDTEEEIKLTKFKLFSAWLSRPCNLNTMKQKPKTADICYDLWGKIWRSWGNSEGILRFMTNNWINIYFCYCTVGKMSIEVLLQVKFRSYRNYILLSARMRGYLLFCF